MIGRFQKELADTSLLHLMHGKGLFVTNSIQQDCDCNTFLAPNVVPPDHSISLVTCRRQE